MKKAFDELTLGDAARLRVLFAVAEEVDISKGILSVSDQLLAYAHIVAKAKLTFGSRENSKLLDDREGCHLHASKESD